VISDIYATEERAKAADFITYSKVFDGVLVAKGNPKKIDGINLSMCGSAAAENTGFVEVPLVQALVPQCKTAGKPEPTMQLYDNNAKLHPGHSRGPRRHLRQRRQHSGSGGEGQSRQAGEGARGDHSLFGLVIAVPKDKPEFRDAVMAALIEIQKAGIHKELLKKWELDPNNFKEPDILSVK